MKDISGNLKGIINQEVLNLVRCWKITLENGNTLCFTTSNEDFVYQNEKYNSISAYEISNLNANIDINDDSAEISNLIVNDLIKDSDILSGLYNNAKVEIFIIDKDNLDGLNYLAEKRIDNVNKMAELGTCIAHVDGGVPNMKIELPQLNEYYLGQLLYFFEIACGISGYLLGVNPFNQPGVEAYKKNMFALLEKPGYEEESKLIKNKL